MFASTLMILSAICGLTHAHGNFSGHFNYYWRQYLGKIPPDAIVGGYDSNGTEIYIGQAFIVNFRLFSGSGIIPVEIHPGIPTVDVPLFGVKEKFDKDVKILCGPQKHYFQWYNTDSKHMFDQLKRKYIIPGGTEDYGMLNIGRLNYENGMRLGKVDTYRGYNKARMYYADEHSELIAFAYQVLVYEDDNIV